jgi:hypothetical protein
MLLRKGVKENKKCEERQNSVPVGVLMIYAGGRITMFRTMRIYEVVHSAKNEQN